MALGEHAGEFVADAFAAYACNMRGERPDGGEGGLVDFEVETGGEADGAEHAQVVFFEAERWVADGAEDAGFDPNPRISCEIYWR